MDMGEAIYREITGGRSPRTEDRDFSDSLDYLVGAFGSASAAARALGVPPSSMRHWVSSGRMPKGPRAGIVTTAARQLERQIRLSEKREKRLRTKGFVALTVKCVIVVSDDDESRDLNLGPYLDDGLEDDLLDAYLAGASIEDLGEMFHQGISGSDFYSDVFDPHGPYDLDVKDIGGWG